jgi:hypothetical protein
MLVKTPVETEVLQSCGAKIKMRTPMHTLPIGSYQALTAAQPHIVSISSECHWLTHTGTILEVWSELLPHWLGSPRGLHPSACASEFLTCPQTPLLPISLKKGGNRLGLSWEFQWFMKISWKGPRKNCPPRKKLFSPPVGPIYLSTDSSHRQVSEYRMKYVIFFIDLTRAVKPCFLHPPDKRVSFWWSCGHPAVPTCAASPAPSLYLCKKHPFVIIALYQPDPSTFLSP